MNFREVYEIRDILNSRKIAEVKTSRIKLFFSSNHFSILCFEWCLDNDMNLQSSGVFISIYLLIVVFLPLSLCIFLFCRVNFEVRVCLAGYNRVLTWYRLDD